jgi:hypothetical protein
MSLVLTLEGGPYDGWKTLYSGKDELDAHGHLYRVVKVGICRIPVKYKFVGLTPQPRCG